MKHPTGHTPPKWASRLLEWYCKPELLEDLQGDLHEYFDRNLATKGLKRARINFVLDVFKFMRPYTIKRPTAIYQLTQKTMLTNHIKITFRNLVKNKTFSLINIGGLSISMVICLLSISFISELNSYDKFNVNHKRIYRVQSAYQRSGQPVLNLASSSVYAAKKIKSAFPEVEDLTLVTYGFEGNALTANNDYVSLNGHWATESFLNVFSFDLKQGNSATALKEPYSLILTERIATSLFGHTQAIGKTVKLQNDQEYKVTGIMADVPTNSHIQFEVLCSFKTKEIEERNNERFDSWTSLFNHYTYLLLPDNADTEALETKLINLSEEENAKVTNRNIVLGLQPLDKIAIGTPLMNDLGFSMDQEVVYMVIGLTFIILLSACFNYTNLSIARSFKRTREIGVRKAMGSTRGQISWLFLTEAIVISILALAIAYPIFEITKGQVLSFDSELQQAISFEMSPRLFLIFVGFALLTGLMAGLLPAILLSKTKVINALKGVFSRISTASSWNMRKALLVVQYTLSLGFILATTISYSQYKYALDYDLGYQTFGIVNLALNDQDAQTVINEFSKHPRVLEISKSMLTLGTGRYLDFYGYYQNPSDSSQVSYNIVDENYLPLHDFEFMAGSNFDKESELAGQSGIIVNEVLLKRFGINSATEALGEQIVLSGNKYSIQGVVSDFHSSSLSDEIMPFAFLSTGGFPNAARTLNLKISNDNLTETMSDLKEALSTIDKAAVFEADFYDEQIKQTYVSFFSIFKIVSILATIAISIAALALLGMAIYTTEIKLKEISIRKVLGAQSKHLAYQLSKGFLYPLILSTVIAIPLTYFVFDEFILDGISYSAPIGIIELFGGLAILTLIVVLTVSGQIFKSVRANPSATLRSE